MGEFELIGRYFAAAACARVGGELLQGIGDDCALLALPPGEHLAVSTDTLVAGVHFPDPCDPFLLAQRALAVSVSDLAAMGADPLAFTLALTLPQAEPAWLEDFARGLERVAAHCGIRLAGGDTTRGPLCLTLTVLGRVPAGQALTRAGARPGELLCVGGPLGAAAAALPLVLGTSSAAPEVAAPLLAEYWTPRPQLALGRWLRERAGAALDISDGLLADCGHIAAASGVRLVIEQARVPCPAPAKTFLGAERALACACSGGDDYRLAFTLAPEHVAELAREVWPVSVIGRVEEGAGLCLLGPDGDEIAISQGGYNHFAEPSAERPAAPRRNA
ncbi:thiamine-phosphate kinase [Stutzerimonas tarimensis]|uniref:Thiamine-monophosphate kinase n=1 Tax=Stutzerimonas tarimensis TaxID=1507735 RepID=A0ABV7T2S3_9GAMM